MSTHSKLSPSSRHRWGKCPASVREEAKYPPEPSGPAAIDGTHSHTLLERCIVDDLSSAFTLIWHTLKDDDGEFVVDVDRAERVDFALAYIDSRLDEAENIGGATVFSERRVDPVHLVKRDDMFGTIDVQILSDELLEIIDYKDGMNIVPAEDNPQLEQYAIGKLSEMVYDQIPLPGRVRMTIIQPKLRTKGMDGIVSWEVSTDTLLARVNRLFAEAAATDDPNAPFNPGEEQCKYCRHKACQARTEYALKASGISFSPVDVAHQSAGKDPATMTNDQLRELIEAAPLLRQMIEAAEAEALRRLEAGGSIAGLKVVRGRGSRAWAFPDDQMEAKLKRFGIPKSAIWETKLLSPAKVEKLQWEKRDGTKHQLTDRQLQTMRAEYITSSEGKLQVVPESDDRKAVTISAAGMFAPVNTEPSLPSFLLPLGA